MLEWLVAVLVGVIGVWAFFNLNLFWRNQKRSDIAHAARSLLVLLEDGGSLSIRVRDSPITLHLTRQENPASDDGALLGFKVPRETWSQPAEDRLRAVCDAHDHDGVFDRSGDSGWLCEIRLRVEDIWDPAAGAGAARLVNLALDALDVEPDARLRFDLVGPRSRRLVERERALRDAGRD